MIAPGDRLTFTGLIAVGTAAAVLSFTALAGLAGLAGVTGHVGPVRLVWLFPVAVDAYAVTVTGVWLRAGSSKGTRAWARLNSLAAIALSMCGNATYHGLTASPGTSIWMVVAVAAVPPLMLGAAVHTAVLVRKDRSRKDRSQDRSQDRGPRTAAQSRPGPAVPPRPVLGGTPTLELVPDGLTAKERAAWQHWEAERAQGRTPTGAELGRAAGSTDSYGRKLRRQWLEVGS